jgi:hypothetical protein
MEGRIADGEQFAMVVPVLAFGGAAVLGLTEVVETVEAQVVIVVGSVSVVVAVGRVVAALAGQVERMPAPGVLAGEELAVVAVAVHHTEWARLVATHRAAHNQHAAVGRRYLDRRTAELAEAEVGEDLDNLVQGLEDIQVQAQHNRDIQADRNLPDPIHNPEVRCLDDHGNRDGLDKLQPELDNFRRRLRQMTISRGEYKRR